MSFVRALSLLFLAWALPQAAFATQFCQNTLVGMAPGGNGVAPTPIFQQQCSWVAGAIAFDPKTRAYASAWNNPNADQALSAAIGSCGAHCAGLSFYEDFAYVAISDDDSTYATSVRSANEAVAACIAQGGRGCEAVIGASSTAEAIYWKFGAVAYDVASGAVGRTANRYRRRDAMADALQACGKETCWSYAFQSGYGAIARSSDGRLFGAWSASNGRFSNAEKAAKKDCKKATGDKDCAIVVSGAAIDFEASIRESREILEQRLEAIERNKGG